MIFNFEKHLVVLATETPNRRELLKRLVPEIHFKVAEEPWSVIPSPEALNAHLKTSVDQVISWCGDYLPRDYSEKFEKMTIIAACSAVVKDGQVMMKLAGDDTQQLAKLAGGSHRILTALRVVSLAPDLHFYWERAEVVETEIWIDAMSESEIADYAVSAEATSLSKDTAWFRPDSRFVEKIIGSDSNVLGLPLCALGRMFHDLVES